MKNKSIKIILTNEIELIPKLTINKKSGRINFYFLFIKLIANLK